jgi:hypothetical protein
MSLIFFFVINVVVFILKLNDYASRKQQDSKVMERWLSPVLNYDAE